MENRKRDAWFILFRVSTEGISQALYPGEFVKEEGIFIGKCVSCSVIIRETSLNNGCCVCENCKKYL